MGQAKKRGTFEERKAQAIKEGREKKVKPTCMSKEEYIMAHEELKKKYEEDAKWHPMPWELWEFGVADNIWQDILPEEGMLWESSLIYRRKPDAPSKNCAMCKFLFRCHGNKWLRWDFPSPPDWCPLDKQEEKPKRWFCYNCGLYLDQDAETCPKCAVITRPEEGKLTDWGAVDSAKKEGSK